MDLKIKLSDRCFFIIVVAMLIAGTGCSSQPRVNIPVYKTPVAYAGVGVGASRLDVDTSDLSFSQTGSGSNATQLTLGLAMADSWGIEARFADLGEAEFDNGSTLDYQTADASMVANALLGSKSKAFARLGVGALDVSGDFKPNQLDDTHIVGGAGVDVELSRRFAVRAEVIAVGGDATQAQLSVLFRFNPREPVSVTAKAAPNPAEQKVPANTAAISKAVVKPAKPKATPEPTITPKPKVMRAPTKPKVISTAPADVDQDGVVDASDQCLTTAPGAFVNSVGCALFGESVPGVVFDNGSAELDAKAAMALQAVVKKLLDNPDLKVVVGAYSSDSGDSASDLLLSRRRTITVIRYLSDAGVGTSRMRPNANALAANPALANRIAIKRL